MNEGRIVFPIPPDRHWADEMPRILPAQESVPKRIAGPRTKVQKLKAPLRPRPLCGGLCFAPAAPVLATTEKPVREKKPRVKNDPKLVAKARDLRDLWLEHVNAGETLLETVGKYDVSRGLPKPAAGMKRLAA
jgi:hypothetical protein